MCTVAEKEALVVKASDIADLVIRSLKNKNDPNANLNWILATRQYLLVNTHENVDFQAWAKILKDFEQQYSQREKIA